MQTLTISPQGQITLPKHLREQLGLINGSRVTLIVNPVNQELIIRRAESIDESAKRISSYIKQGTKPIKDIRVWLDQNWEIKK